MVKTVVIAVTNDLMTDQRVARVAETFWSQGYIVTLVGRFLSHSIPVNRNYKTRRFKLWFNKGPLFYANYNLRLFFFLVFSKCRFVLANDLDTLLGAYLACIITRKKLIYDSHEYFTEVPELIGRKLQQKAWQMIEKWIVPRLTYTYTVSESIANAYNLQYKANFRVIRNLPVHKEIEPSLKEKAIIYQGALNIGRGIELMIQCMPYLEGYQLWIAGTGDIDQQLKDLVSDIKMESRVKFLGRVSPDNLHSITTTAQLGLSLEEDRGKNYLFALPNKLFDYIQAQIPVLVSDLPEMRKVVLEYGIGEVLKSREPEEVAQQIKTMLNDQEKQKIWSMELQKAAMELCWENEEKKLIKLIGEIESRS